MAAQTIQGQSSRAAGSIYDAIAALPERPEDPARIGGECTPLASMYYLQGLVENKNAQIALLVRALEKWQSNPPIDSWTGINEFSEEVAAVLAAVKP